MLTRDKSQGPFRQSVGAVVLVCLVGLWAYHNSFWGAFVFDDHVHILENPRIKHLWPLWATMAAPPDSDVAARPIVNLTLALNYALSGLQVWSYHVVNLAIHLLAALVLFGLVRRTLQQPGMREANKDRASGLALAVALLWVVHPLQTQSVTYIIQRAESLMGLCYLLTLYAVVRGSDPPTPRGWYGVAVLACALGMGCKPVMATCPVAIWLYDRAFLAGSFREAWRRRGGLYLALAATWVFLAWLLVATAPRTPEPAAGFAFRQIRPLSYAATQPGVLLHYLRLVVWPAPLALDYQWPVARTFAEIAFPSVLVGALGAAAAWTMRRMPRLGFLGAWFFLVLLPTSSIIPLADPAVEHRMYLPLAAAVALLVLGADWVLRHALPSRDRLRQGVAAGLLGVIVLTFGLITIRRNADYRTEVAIWSATVAVRPQNPRAPRNLGAALGRASRYDEAIRSDLESLRLDPSHPQTHSNLGATLAEQGDLEGAIAHDLEALRLNPRDADAHSNLANTLLKLGDASGAAAHHAQALRLKPYSPQIQVNAGAALAARGELPEAIAHYEEALRLDPDNAQAHTNLGNALAKQGRLADAIAHYQQALRREPQNAETHNNLGVTLMRHGESREAVGQFREALRLNPRNADAHANLGNILAAQGRFPEAVVHYSEALRLNPRHAEAHSNLGVVFARQGNLDEAILHFTEALRLNPDLAGVRQNLETALIEREKQ